MGLDINHDAFSGAYSAFNRFRQFVLKSIGGSYPPHEDRTLDENFWYWEDSIYNPETYRGLYEFFTHSDCDGEINPEMCKLVADELEYILPKIEELSQTEEANGHILRNGGYIAVTKQFINGCRLAYKNNKPLIFG
jgi:hypothetical protein